VQLQQTNQYHLLLGDVEELVGGAQVIQLAGYQTSKNGGVPVKPKVHWDDSQVEQYLPQGPHSQTALTTEPKLVRTPEGGIAQSGPVHGWNDTYSTNGVSGWGNNAVISLDLADDISGDVNLQLVRNLKNRHLEIVTKTGQLAAPAAGARRATYQVTVKNTGNEAFTAGALAQVVDTLPLHMSDWRWEGTSFDAGTSASAASGNFAAGKLTWKAPLRAGETAIIRYSGRVDPGFSASRINTVTTANCPPVVEDQKNITVSTCESAPQKHELKVPGLSVAKTVETTGLHQKGNQAHYTVQLTNVGQAAYTVADPARVTDDLSGVLDDSVLDPASLRPAGAVWDPKTKTIVWSGPLAVGATQTITYTVAYAPGDSNLLLENAASIYPEDVLDVTPGVKAQTSTPGSDLHVSKAADVKKTAVGGTVKYTITLNNQRGRTAAPVVWTDDLTGVLDDAQLQDTPVVEGSGVTVNQNGKKLVLGGQVASGAVVKVVYSVKVAAQGGDRVLRNVLQGECAAGSCPQPTECREDNPLSTCTPVISYRVEKTATGQAAGRAPRAGEAVTYRLTFTNTGGGVASVSKIDDLTGVLDDAVLEEIDRNMAGPLQAEWQQPQLKISGELPVGGRVELSYRVRVKPAEERGDHELVNVVTKDGPTTRTPVGELKLIKTVEPKRTRPGEVVRYTLSLKATGKVVVPVELRDNLTYVLDDAVMVVLPVSNNPAVKALYEPGVSAITIEGKLEPGAETLVTYAVQVKPKEQLQDLVLANVVLEPSAAPLSDEGSPDCSTLPPGQCTQTPVDVPAETAPAALPITGSGAMLWAGLGAGILLTAGGLLWGRSRWRIRRLADPFNR
jgi:hypothetical protein